MSILREAGRQQRLCCDDCGAEGDEFDSGNFGRMIEAAKSDGWQITQVGGVWTHKCCECPTVTETSLGQASIRAGIGQSHLTLNSTKSRKETAGGAKRPK